MKSMNGMKQSSSNEKVPARQIILALALEHAWEINPVERYNSDYDVLRRKDESLIVDYDIKGNLIGAEHHRKFGQKILQGHGRLESVLWYIRRGEDDQN